MWRQLSSWAKVFDTHFAPNANLKSIAIDMEVWNHCPLSQFNFIRGFASSGGRNSAGRITSFHRGGGVKRLPRKIDVKRSNSALGIVERIEYDPNRSARIAFVRWVEGVKVRRKQCNVKGEFSPPVKTLEPTTTNIRGIFSFCSMPGKTVQRKVACDSPATMMGYAAVGVPTTMAPLSNAQSSTASKKNSARDVFMSAFSPGAIISSGKSSVVPRMVVAGAKPPFFSLQKREEVKDKSSFSLSEVQKWRVNSTFWSNRIKRKAAISWQNFRQQLRLGLVKSGEHDGPKSK